MLSLLAAARAHAAIFKSFMVIPSVSDSEDSDKLESVEFCLLLEAMIEEML